MTLTEAFGSVADAIAHLDPDKLLEIKAAPELSVRVEELTWKKKDGTITEAEALELERFLALDMLISMAKARARKLLAA
jgi:hypothetical protein